ncbi:protein kinase domain-containing protein [Yinghuangia seranimata]|uniref:serine/threonine-protein kinase n=1 Tax=Yinghuangia seranimata TaxID=408067 RepID=UPI00248C2D1F|nr:serine/threonine-protein kinase [Yinghuangia seranimata]MDI2128343.1 PQQ-binding-like beta-propeller repeat protein [Yinghuangia seranimata]
MDGGDVDALDASDPRRVGPYSVFGRLGSGGMGKVYLGRSGGGRTVAIKVIRPELADDPVFRVRFGQEVKAARKVSGAFTAAVVDAEPTAPVPWMATTYVAGIPLNDAVLRHGPLPEASVRMLLAGMAEALRTVHDAGLIHRDLKPSNVLLALDGPHVIDFGITKAVDGTAYTATAAAPTATGAVVGSPGYMSPEQAQAKPLTPASDVFSLASTAYFAATGAAAFGTGPWQALMYSVITNEPDYGPVPPALRDLFEACFAKDPERRPTPDQVVAFIEEGSAPVGMGSWLPDQLTADVSAARTALLALPSPPVDPAGGDRDPGTPDPRFAAATVPVAVFPTRADTPPPDDREPVFRIAPAGPIEPKRETRGLTRRRLLFAAGGTVAVAGIGTAAALLANGGGSDGVGTTALDAPAVEPVSVTTLDTQAANVAFGANVLVLLRGTSVSGLDRSGKPVWGPLPIQTMDSVLPVPTTVVGTTLYLCAMVGQASLQALNSLVAVDLAAGNIAWSLAVPEPKWYASYAGGALGGEVFVNGVVSDTSTLNSTGTFVWAVDTAERKKAWTLHEEGLGSLVLVPPTGSRVLLAKVSGPDGEIQSVDAANGARGWTRQLPGAATIVGLGPRGGACYAGGRIVCTGTRLVALDPGSGNQVWVYESGTATASFGWPVASPDGRTVFVVRGSELHAVDAASGKAKWRSALKTGKFAGVSQWDFGIVPELADGNLYLTDDQSNLWAIDTATGNARWKHHNPALKTTKRAYGGGKVWIVDDLAVRAIDAAHA